MAETGLRFYRAVGVDGGGLLPFGFGILTEVFKRQSGLPLD